MWYVVLNEDTNFMLYAKNNNGRIYVDVDKKKHLSLK